VYQGGYPGESPPLSNLFTLDARADMIYPPTRRPAAAAPHPQHDLLEYIFSDKTRCFTIPELVSPPVRKDVECQQSLSNVHSDDGSIPRLTFSELYAYTLAASPKVTKGLKEALLDLQPGELPGKSKAGQGKTRKKVKGGPGGPGAAAAGEDELAGGPVGEGDELADAEEIENYDGLKDGYMKLCLLVSMRASVCIVCFGC
jgi:hypothetical protein